MNKMLKQSSLIIALFLSGIIFSQNKFDTPYGRNDDVGKTVEINGAKIYYEEYGEGEPLIFIHGNGGDISGLGNRIEYFKTKYRVIAADSRGHGKSELKTDSLTYRQTANDLEGLVKHLKLDSIRIVGTSDGAIVGLLMGINNNVKIKRIVAWAGNLRPDTTAVHAWAPKSVRERWEGVKKVVDGGNTNPYWNRRYQRYGLMLFQPNISHEELKKITAPVLVIAGDRDVIKNSHSVEIFENIQNSQLCILPGATHFAPYRQPERFNRIVDRFISEPFTMPDSDSSKN